MVKDFVGATQDNIIIALLIYVYIQHSTQRHASKFAKVIVNEEDKENKNKENKPRKAINSNFRSH